MVKEMADDQVPIAEGIESNQSNSPKKCPESGNGQSVKSTTPSSGNNTEVPNKRKRESVSATLNNENKSKLANDKPVADTTETECVKDVEMKDAESVDVQSEQGFKEVEMQDAEMHHDKTCLEDNSREALTCTNVSNDDTRSTLNAAEEPKDDQSIKEIEKPTKVEASENNDKRSVDVETSDDSGQRMLSEVATLLKQVEESDAKAKLEVEVKVKKLDHGDLKENDEINKSETAAHDSKTAAQVS